MDRRSYVDYRRFLALKVAVPWLIQPAAFALPAVAGLLTAWTGRYARWGIAVLLGLACYEVYDTWPLTLNHIALETIILAILALDDGDDHLGMKMIRALMVSVWIYSGFQKIVHGYFASGEYLALEALSRESHLGRNLARFFPGPHLECCVNGALTLPLWESALFRFLGVATIITEIFLPLTLLFRRTRHFGVVALLLFQLTIGLSSSEIDFAFTATATLLLWAPAWTRPAYLVLAAVYLGYGSWR